MANLHTADALFANYLKTAESIVTNFDDDKKERDKQLEVLKDAVIDSCRHDIKLKKILENVRELSNSVGGQTDVEVVLAEYKQKKNELLSYSPDVSNHQNLSMFNQQLREILASADGVKPQKGDSNNDEDDDDIQFTQNDINVIDPFSKKRMVEPVKNRECGHIYDRETATKIIQTNPNTRCPVVGCVTRNYVTLENLVPDIVTRKYLHDNPE